MSSEIPARIAKKKELEIDPLFQGSCEDLSDLHLKVDRPPYVRVKGTLRANRGPIDDEDEPPVFRWVDQP